VFGPVGSGKSTFSVMLANKLGWSCISADMVVHQMLDQATTQLILTKYFGTQIVHNDGTINKTVLGNLVFRDHPSLNLLERILWPMIEERLKTVTRRNLSNNNGTIIDAAVLISARWHKICDKIIYIDAKKNVRQQRLRDKGIEDSRIFMLMSAQEKILKQKKRADVIIQNNKSLLDLEKQITKLVLKWIPTIPSKEMEAQ